MVKDREAGRAAVHGVTESQVQLSNWTTTYKRKFLHSPAHTWVKDVNLQSFPFDSSSKPLKGEQNGMEEIKQSPLALISGQK